MRFQVDYHIAAAVQEAEKEIEFLVVWFPEQYSLLP